MARKTTLNRHWGHRFLEFSAHTVKTVCRSSPYYSTLTTAKRRSKSGRLRSTIDVHTTIVCVAVDQLLQILNSFATPISAYPYNRHLAFEFLYRDGTVRYFFFFAHLFCDAYNPEISHTIPHQLLIPLSHTLMAYRQRSAVENGALYSTIDILSERTKQIALKMNWKHEEWKR